MRVRYFVLYFLLALFVGLIFTRYQKTHGSITLESKTYQITYSKLASVRAVTENTNGQVAVSLKDCNPENGDVACKACMAYNSGSGLEYAVMAQPLEIVFTSGRMTYRVGSIRILDETFFNRCHKYEHLPFCVADYGPWNIRLEAGQGTEFYPDKPRFASEKTVREFCGREGYIGPILLSK